MQTRAVCDSMLAECLFTQLSRSRPRYHSSIAEAQSKLPFPAGFESVGVVVAAGDGEQQHWACASYPQGTNTVGQRQALAH